MRGVGTASAVDARVQNIRLGASEGATRLVLEMSSVLILRCFSLDAPRRIVLDLPSLDWPDVNASPEPKGLISGLRFGQFTATQSRLVIDLNTPAMYRAVLLDPASGFPHRLVVDLKTSSARISLNRLPQTGRPNVPKPLRPAHRLKFCKRRANLTASRSLWLMPDMVALTPAQAGAKRAKNK